MKSLPDSHEDHNLVDGWQVGEEVQEHGWHPKNGVSMHQPHSRYPGNGVLHPSHGSPAQGYLLVLHPGTRVRRGDTLTAAPKQSDLSLMVAATTLSVLSKTVQQVWATRFAPLLHWLCMKLEGLLEQLLKVARSYANLPHKVRRGNASLLPLAIPVWSRTDTFTNIECIKFVR